MTSIDKGPNNITPTPGLSLESMGDYAIKHQPPKIDPSPTELPTYEDSSTAQPAPAHEARGPEDLPQLERRPSIRESSTEGLVDGNEPLQRRNAPRESSTAGQVNAGIKNPRLKKGFLGTFFVAGMAIKTILNIPVLKQLWEVTSFVGELGGRLVGGFFGCFIGKPVKGWELGGKIGLALLDPRSIFNGLCKAGDSFLKERGTSPQTRMLIHNFTNVNINVSQGRSEFFDKEFKGVLAEVAINAGETQEEAQKLAEQWLLTVKNDSWQNLNERPHDMRNMQQLGQWGKDAKDSADQLYAEDLVNVDDPDRKIPTRTVDTAGEANMVACIAGKEKLDKILNDSLSVGDDNSILFLKKYNRLMAAMGVKDADQENASPYSKSEFESLKPLKKIDNAFKEAITKTVKIDIESPEGRRIVFEQDFNKILSGIFDEMNKQCNPNTISQWIFAVKNDLIWEPEPRNPPSQSPEDILAWKNLKKNNAYAEGKEEVDNLLTPGVKTQILERLDLLQNEKPYLFVDGVNQIKDKIVTELTKVKIFYLDEELDDEPGSNIEEY